MEELQQMDSLGLLCCLYREPGVPEMTFERDGLPAQEIWSLPAPSLSGLRVSPRLPLPTRTFISGTSFHFKISALCALPWAPLGGGDVPGCGCGLHPGGVAPPVPFPEGAVQGGDAGECPEPALCGPSSPPRRRDLFFGAEGSPMDAGARRPEELFPRRDQT
ncbi:uncharacterized protein LOC100009932 isoform X5 [Monodelphis domestica]|uniref:uncharacterized protein LOC100009932 isoform X5 n=1 Tax=Monodelphis domestica TaxID=13616 RepID=UPI0024E1C9DF|nr:uncharacterized protein LOC100009932 isoform X5 [Monodelphis domestica]